MYRLTIVLLSLFLAAVTGCTEIRSVPPKVSVALQDPCDINLNQYCDAKYQYSGVNEDGAPEKWCLDEQGKRHGLSVEGKPTFRIDWYAHGVLQRTLFGGSGAKSKSVGLVALVSNPEKYHGQQLRVKGYFKKLHPTFSALLISDGFPDLKNAIWVSLPQYYRSTHALQVINRKNVVLEGTFDMDNRGYQGNYAGSISLINRIEPTANLGGEIKSENQLCF